MKKSLSKLERIPLREAWKHEANDFTPWLAQEENLNALSEALSLGELELVAKEHWVGEFKLDILCACGDEQVIIENQLEKTNHTHLGQILTYAAGTGAKKVIWIAESFRPEHVAALEFLNQNTTDDLNFFAVEVELWRIGDYGPHKRQNARPVMRQAGLLFKVQLLIVFGTTAAPRGASGWFGQHPCSTVRNSPLPHLQR